MNLRSGKVTRNLANPILLVLDLNGTLIDRLVTSTDKALARQNPLCPLVPDFHLNGARVYLRPYLDRFLDDLFQEFKVAVWTSATTKNSVPLVQNIFGKRCKQLAFHWDRSRCDLVSEIGNPYGSVKNLEKVWLDSTVNAGGIWSEKNTLLIDDTPRKSTETPQNLLWLPTYAASNLTINFDHDTTLLCVSAYLQRLAAAHKVNPVEDVRKWVEDVPLFVKSEEHQLPVPYLEFAVTPGEELIERRHRKTRMSGN
ncbi:hypothetical protein HDU67_008264 [Dinochytrium kinnereticum]|nr:hypothetical protein HDU67_008264 [Dinochytrium kinnereticum]